MLRKLIVAVVMVALLLSMAACSQTPSPTNTPVVTATTQPTVQPTVEPSATSSQSDVMTPDGKYSQTVVVTFGQTTFSKLPANMTNDNNRMSKYILDKYNIQVKCAWAVDSNTYDQKVALSIASGDIPDVMTVSDRKTLQQMQDAGLLADMTDAFNKCISPFLKEQYDSFNGKLLSQATFGGKLMAIPGCNIGGAENLLWIRKDWLDKVGLQPPKTIDDIINIAKTFIEKDPGGNGPGNTIGLTGKQDVAGIYNSMHGFDTIFSLYGAYPKQWIKDASGNVIYGSVAPEMKQALTKLNEMYKAGVIDKLSYPATGHAI